MKRPKSLIHKISPPKPKTVLWHVSFRHTQTGVCIDITHQFALRGLKYKLSRTSYLISQDQLKEWLEETPYSSSTLSGKWMWKPKMKVCKNPK